MFVEILNPESLKILYKSHGEFACVCYDTPIEKGETVGKHCQASGHMSGSRCEYIKFRIGDVDRGTAEQIMRHEIGVRIPFDQQDNYSFSDYSELVKDVNPNNIVKNMASFRYIDKEGFKYAVPVSIDKFPETKALYQNLMLTINSTRSSIKRFLIKNGVPHEIANEDVNFVLPRATTTDLVIGFTPEALIHFCHKRLCTRAQMPIRNVANEIKKKINEINPDFAKELVPQCEHLLWCPEKKSCGLMPTKKETQEILDLAKGGVDK